MTDLKRRVAQKMAKVAMFHIGRSGSTVTGDLLSQNPNIYWDGELFEATMHGSFRYFSQLLPGRLTEFVRLHALKARLLKGGAKYYGFETKFFHLSRAQVALEDYLADLGGLGLSHVIVLKRKNYLRKMISSAIAQQRQQYHLGAHEASSLTKVSLPVEAAAIDRATQPLVSHFQQWDESFRALDRAVGELPVLRLTYEDDVSDNPQVAYGKICDFLGIEVEQAQVGFAKTNPFAVQEMLLNFEQVAEALAGTPYEWMLWD
ncbi:MAG TPA: hypothetical protein VLS96_19070 [Nodosilinea sp.]|nr:hypothetical protein [Nodosilinea sp.]